MRRPPSKVTRRRALAIAAVVTAGLPAAPAFARDTSTFDQIEKRQQLRVGVTPAEPWFVEDPATGKWTGIGIAIGQRLAASLGVEMVPVETTWANAVAGLQANQFDIMLVLDPTEERRKVIDFPRAPLFYYAMGALVAEASTLRAWSDLDTSGTRIAVTFGTSIDKTVTAMAPSAGISRFSNNDEAIAAFAAERVDVVVQEDPALVVAAYAELKRGKVVLPEPVEPIATSAGLRKTDDPSFRDWLSDRFADFYAAGVPDQLFAAYLRTKNINPDAVPGLVKESWK